MIAALFQHFISAPTQEECRLVKYFIHTSEGAFSILETTNTFVCLGNQKIVAKRANITDCIYDANNTKLKKPTINR